jgi:hypothetical protein
MPTLGFHVPDDSPIIEQVKRKADRKHDGKVSAYVRNLVEQDLLNDSGQTETNALSPTVIDELAKRLCGELVARELADGLATQSSYPNQAYLLRDILFALTEFFAQGGTFKSQDEDDTRPRITNSASIPKRASVEPGRRNILLDPSPSEIAAAMKEKLKASPMRTTPSQTEAEKK